MKIARTSVLLLCLVSLCGCKTLLSKVGFTSYKPETYGTQALMDMLAKADASDRDAASAAEELARRELTKDDGEELFKVLTQDRPTVNIEVLRTIRARKMTYLADDLRKHQKSIQNAKVADENVQTVVAFLDKEKDRVSFMVDVLSDSPHAMARCRAAVFLQRHEKEALPLFIEKLEKEESASVAKAMCDGLLSFESKKSFDVLSSIANDVTRKFTKDRYLDDVTTANDVRAVAVRAVERLKRQ